MNQGTFTVYTGNVFRGSFDKYREAVDCICELKTARAPERISRVEISVREGDPGALVWITPFDPGSTAKGGKWARTEVWSRCRSCSDLCVTTSAWDCRCLACAPEFHKFDDPIDTESLAPWELRTALTL